MLVPIGKGIKEAQPCPGQLPTDEVAFADTFESLNGAAALQNGRNDTQPVGGLCSTKPIVLAQVTS